MNPLVMNVLSFLGIWFVVSVALGLFAGACMSEKQPIAGPAPSQSLSIPHPSRIERRSGQAFPVSIDRRTSMSRKTALSA
jgi:hypothetical protein